MKINRTFKGLVLASFILITGLVMVSCGSSDEAKKTDSTSDLGTSTKGVLTIGLDDTFAPMGFRDENQKLVGFDIDLARAVGQKMGLKVKFKPISWDAKDLELNSGNIDAIWNGMSATPEREKAMSLSKKYLNNKIVLLKLKDKDFDIKDSKELSKYQIGTQADSSALEMLKKDPSYEAFKNNIREYKDYDQALLDLRAGRVDVVAIDQVLGAFKNKNLKGILQETSYDLGNDFYVIGFRKSDTALTEAVNKVIDQLIKDGTASDISKKWFSKNIVIFEDL